MNKLQDWLSRAAGMLDISVDVGYVVNLKSGESVESLALIPNFGATLGTLIFTPETTPRKEVRQELKTLGYTISTYGEPSENMVFDLNDYIEMLTDWGWTGDQSRMPNWMSLR